MLDLPPIPETAITRFGVEWALANRNASWWRRRQIERGNATDFGVPLVQSTQGELYDFDRLPLADGSE